MSFPSFDPREYRVRLKANLTLSDFLLAVHDASFPGVEGEDAAVAYERHRQVLEQKHAVLLERYTLIQYILLKQHRTFMAHMQTLGLKIYGDVQVGLSLRDA